METIRTSPADIDSRLGALAAITAIENPKALTPPERLHNATVVQDLVEDGVRIDVTAIHPHAVGIETLTYIRQVLRGHVEG